MSEYKSNKLTTTEERYLWLGVLIAMICVTYYVNYQHSVPLLKLITSGFTGIGIGTMIGKILL